MGKSSKHENKSKKKHKHKERKEKKKKSKKLKKHSKEKKDKDKKADEQNELRAITTENRTVKDNDDDFAIPVELMNSKSHAPETPEEYQQRQNRIRREIDPVTGRSRLIKGDGEVLEEIVSKERHKTINKEATKGDGEFFQENTLAKLY
ncbi:ADP-ribosylation factor-like protein 6-interacting protein 4 [Lucilia sericata]|uniref:ADP-ribosylation factor-like protein 6-interacting protein 4 n=1 Tax=Lucilia sericata TaxID=13632 RepID=UPI0018A83C20|nr:ADP-ribosylation factor-like protein 6-interacting protein 4 [Lucilia sericata]